VVLRVYKQQQAGVVSESFLAGVNMASKLEHYNSKTNHSSWQSAELQRLTDHPTHQTVVTVRWINGSERSNSRVVVEAWVRRLG